MDPCSLKRAVFAVSVFNFELICRKNICSLIKEEIGFITENILCFLLFQSENYLFLSLFASFLIDYYQFFLWDVGVFKSDSTRYEICFLTYWCS